MTGIEPFLLPTTQNQGITNLIARTEKTYTEFYVYNWRKSAKWKSNQAILFQKDLMFLSFLLKLMLAEWLY